MIEYSDKLAVCFGLCFFFSLARISSILCHSGLTQLGADKACEDGPLGPSQHLPAVVLLSHWFRVALAVTAPWTSVEVAVSG